MHPSRTALSIITAAITLAACSPPENSGYHCDPNADFPHRLGSFIQQEGWTCLILAVVIYLGYLGIKAARRAGHKVKFDFQTMQQWGLDDIHSPAVQVLTPVFVGVLCTAGCYHASGASACGQAEVHEASAIFSIGPGSSGAFDELTLRYTG